MEQFLKYLQNDLKTAKKIEDDPNYYNRLLKVDQYVKDLKIMSELQFLAYSMVLEELKNISYKDIQAFQRFKCKEYYEEVQRHLNKKNTIKRIK